MKKLGNIAYNKLLLQGEEAKERGMEKLANSIFNAIGPTPRDKEDFIYSKNDLETDIKNNLWKTATNVIAYYDVNSIDAEKVNDIIEVFAKEFIDQLKAKLKVQEEVGKFEPPLPGQF